MMYEAAPWDQLSELSTYVLSGGGGLLAMLAVLAYVANDKGKSRRPNEEFNRAIERVVGGAVAGIGRYVAGRDLTGDQRSTATWWRSGVVVDDGGRLPSVEPRQSGDLAKAPAGAVGRTARAVGRVVAGMGAALRAWVCWPGAARSAVRLLPLPLAWLAWQRPAALVWAVGVLVAVVVAVAATGPAGARWWAVRTATDDELLGPSMWAGVRQVLRLDEGERRVKWLRLDADLSVEGAGIVLRLPVQWMGGKEGMAALSHVVDARVPGEWVAEWERQGAAHHVRWTRKKQPVQPTLSSMVTWRSLSSPYEVYIGQAIEGESVVDVVVQTQSATPHWGVAGDTGAGKSTVLYIPIVHGRLHGVLVDILDTKQNSLMEAEGFSGVRIHKSVRECIAAFGEFMASMQAAETAQGKNADPALRGLLQERLLVIDELPTLIKLAYIWWRYGLKGKGSPPFLEWLSVILLQGRSANHRVVVGTQQFANSFFGGTMERGQIGTKIMVGSQERVSYGVAFGQSTPVVPFDTEVKGRGVYADKRMAPGANFPYVREIQLCKITDEVAGRLGGCRPAPAWFDAGERAPWITESSLMETHRTTGVKDFLVGGKYGPEEVVTAAVTSVSHLATSGVSASSGHVTGTGVTAPVTGGVTAGAPAVGGVVEPEDLPPVYTLAEACEAGILPWSHGTARQYKRRGEARGIEFPEGISDGRATSYSEAELVDWYARYKAGK
ncbi:type IV secretory system conjugative DNA transfer family protein [Streptomyces sp. NPDC048606]|uniref:type IV secretory system conjugative DNA transfer family protein n=1 Tax=Streptomyces sp. NPDC048606 TaxID=3154726 RepID=UPI00341A6226